MDRADRQRAPAVRRGAARPRAAPVVDDDVARPAEGSARPSERRVQVWQRAAGNRAVAAKLATDLSAPSRPRPVTAGVAVQRWAWVGGRQVAPADPTLDPAMKAFAADAVVRDYGTDAEFKAHAAGTTDHLGTLPGPASKGTWVRFAPSGTNLLGEDHTQVTLEDVMPAVGSKSFIYEPFSVDSMPAGSDMQAAYEQETKARFAKMGVGGVADKRQFGSESLFPKMGFGLNLIVPILRAGRLDQLKAAAYVGQPAQRYLKIAWGYTKDVAGEIAVLKVNKKKVPAELRDLERVRKALAAQLDPFITGLVVDGYLGDALDTEAGKKLVPALVTFCEAFVAAMLARAGTDTALTAAERADLKSMKTGTQAEQSAMFSKWRDLHFSHAVKEATARGVRYAGMGKNHMDFLIAEGLPAGSRTYDMTAAGLAAFELLTKNRAASAASAAAP